MAEVTTAPTTAGAQTNAVPASSNPATQGSNPAINPNEVAELRTQVSKLSAHVRRLVEGKVKPSGSAASATNPATEQVPQAKQMSELEAMRAQVKALTETNERREKEAERKQKHAEIKSAIAAHGIDSDNALYLEDHIHQRHADRIGIDGDAVFYENAMGERLTVKDFISTLPNLDRFRPVVQTPNSRGTRPSANTHTGPRIPYGELSPEKRAAMSDDERRAYVRADLGR